MDQEVLDSRPSGGGQPSTARRLVVKALVVTIVVVVVVAAEPAWQGEPVVCREGAGASWCSSPSPALRDPNLRALVAGYCPLLRALPTARVVPQELGPLHLAPAGPYRAVRADGPAGSTESVVLGEPGRLARVIRSEGRRRPWALQVVCRGGGDSVPALVLDGQQLRATLRAEKLGGGLALDLRWAARVASRAARRDATDEGEFGTFSCTTGRSALSLEPGARFFCQLELFEAYRVGLYRALFKVAPTHPHVRLVKP